MFFYDKLFNFKIRTTCIFNLGKMNEQYIAKKCDAFSQHARNNINNLIDDCVACTTKKSLSGKNSSRKSRHTIHLNLQNITYTNDC